ncbi:hypothetical protein KIL84_017950 [Mauremys mutica]|uniref:Uncharacterized protein n=1 Tax=Mauremys mutica TaxID=74926 RepID=A0A9D3XSA0_9SAUR|nr:hypothetical protein KIL84_017950 [Mauremys mutica]
MSLRTVSLGTLWFWLLPLHPHSHSLAPAKRRVTVPQPLYRELHLPSRHRAVRPRPQLLKAEGWYGRGEEAPRVPPALRSEKAAQQETDNGCLHGKEEGPRKFSLAQTQSLQARAADRDNQDVIITVECERIRLKKNHHGITT